MKPSFLGLVLLGLATSGCVVYSTPPRRVVYVRNDPAPPPNYDDWPHSTTAPSQDPGTTVVEYEAPPPRYEVITESPGVDFVWVGGYWAWRGGWAWCPGYWHRGHCDWAWRSGGWDVRGGRSYWRAGVWVRHR